MKQEEYRKMFALEDTHWWFCAKRMYAQVFLGQARRRFAKILDIGCGTGRNLLMLKDFGESYGVDLSPLALKFCSQRHQALVKFGGAEELPFADKSFDLVTIFDVLYHQGIRSDLKALAEAYRVLKPGGYLLVNDCAHQWLYGPHDRAMKARQRYSRSELKGKIIRAGFKVKRASYTNMLTFPLFLLNRLLKKYLNVDGGSDVGSLPEWLNRSLLVICRIESKVLKYLDLPIGSSIMVLAQKPKR